MTVYGIPNCDTVQKALTWLKANQIEFEFHNFKTAGIEPQKLKLWNKKAGLEAFLNKKSATWRGLDDTQKEAAYSLLLAAQSLKKLAIYFASKNCYF